MSFISIGTTLPLDDFNLNNLEREYYSNRAVTKKDIFTSRGWGAAGMPYSLYYINKPMQSRTNQQQIVEVNDQHREEDGNFEALRSNEDPAQKSKNDKNNKYVIPQLFVSYGWGPMG